MPEFVCFLTRTTDKTQTLKTRVGLNFNPFKDSSEDAGGADAGGVDATADLESQTVCVVRGFRSADDAKAFGTAWQTFEKKDKRPDSRTKAIPIKQRLLHLSALLHPAAGSVDRRISVCFTDSSYREMAGRADAYFKRCDVLPLDDWHALVKTVELPPDLTKAELEYARVLIEKTKRRRENDRERKRRDRATAKRQALENKERPRQRVLAALDCGERMRQQALEALNHEERMIQLAFEALDHGEEAARLQ